MTFAEQRQQKELKRGIEGEFQLVFKQLKLKFGEEADDYEQALRSASLLELDKIAKQILSANKIEDIF